MQIQERTEHGLYYKSWLAQEPKAAVLLIHGLGEHCQRYEHLADALNKAGVSLYSMDLPCHGKSEGSRGHVETFDVFEQAALSLYASIEVDVPIFLLGHSLGGLIASHFLIGHQDKFRGAMLSAPAIQSPQEPPAWQVGIIKMIAKLFPKTALLQLDASGISRDAAVVDKYMNDPLVNKDKLSAKFLLEMTNTMEAVKHRANEITLPILIMHGTADTMTAPAGSELLHSKCSSDDKSIRLYDGLFHEIFNEPEQKMVITEVIDWIKARA
jgi:alpha-beta hydrolase superfamily lysophospholipase